MDAVPARQVPHVYRGSPAARLLPSGGVHWGKTGWLLNLRWADIDATNLEVAIRGSVSVIEGRRVEGTTKGGHSRVVSIEATTVRVLRAHRKRQNEEQLIAEDEWTDSDLVFRTGFGKPIHPDTPSQLMPKLIAHYNLEHPDQPLPPARLHDLRHIHATTLLLAGEPVHVVAARLGHADPAITLQV